MLNNLKNLNKKLFPNHKKAPNQNFPLIHINMKSQCPYLKLGK